MKLGDDRQVTIADNVLYFNAGVLAKDGPAAVPPTAVAGYGTTRRFDLATGRGAPRGTNVVLDLADLRVERAALHDLLGGR